MLRSVSHRLRKARGGGWCELSDFRVISLLGKIGKSFVSGGVRGYFQAAAFNGDKNVFGQLEQCRRILGGLPLCDTCSTDIMNYIIITKHSL